MCDISSDNDSMDETLSEIRDREAVAGSNYLLPERSKKQYDKVYQDFMRWKQSKCITTLNEAVLLEYFKELGEKFKSSTLYTFYSMLKCTLSLNHEVDISKYTKLMAYLKQQSEGYQGKKSKTFSPEEIIRFLNEAADRDYLLTKIALIFGIVGACRRQELYKLLYKDVEIYGSTMLVKVNNLLSKQPRTFAITGKYYDLCKKFISLRPTPCDNPHFFLYYKAGKCTPQSVGINNFGRLGKTIAQYLELPNPELYTGHCFRRTSRSIAIDAYGDVSLLTKHGRWKSHGATENGTPETNAMDSEIEVPCLIPYSPENNRNKEESVNFLNTTPPENHTNNNPVDNDLHVTHQILKSFENKTIEYVNINLPSNVADVCMDNSVEPKDRSWNERDIVVDIPNPTTSDGYNSDSMDNKSQVWHHVQNSIINNRSKNVNSNTPSTSVSESFIDDSTKSRDPIGNPIGNSADNSNKVVNINIPASPNLQQTLGALVRFSNCNIQNVNINYYNK